nr:type I polyketide synthase [Streptomyces radicis]
MSNEAKLRDYLKRATTDLRQANERLSELEARTHEPIAIVGMACRYPGDVRSPEDLWLLVAEGGDAVTGLPENRGWDLEALYDPDPTRPGTSYVREGGFLHDADAFDAEFFGISPREALAMDPQQRLLLETSWEVLERAGIPAHSLAGSDTGVFVGAAASGYGVAGRPIEAVEGYAMTGKATSVISGRVAYTLGLEGPAVTVDTACSSSLVALHLAVRALRNGECALALAGGVTVLPTPESFIEFSRQRGLAADGRCKAFAASADGTGWAEGAGVLLVERLSDAERLGHPVLAVIRGSAINQDGASNGLTAPSGPSQRRVIRQALSDAGLASNQVDVVEAHGTGTSLGDPIEAEALLATYGQGRAPERPLWLGSFKSNIGHAQWAAGVGGVIKMVMALRHGVLPGTLHVDEPSPHVDWSAGAVELLTEAREWPETGRPRRAGVSSFGISGTNAHLILEEAPEPEAASSPGAGVVGGVVPWVVSARGEAALAEQVARLGELGSSPVEVGWSLLSSRSVLEDRAVVLDGSPEPVTGRVLDGAGRAVFVFPGQGAQWSGMALELADAFPVFRAALEECAAALAEFVEWDFWAELDGDLARVDVVQPLSWAVMVSLARLWEWLGVRPSAVVGHSQGEVAAAVVAGALSLDDGARVVALRSALIGERLAGRGGMVSVAVGAGEAEESLSPFGGLSVAAVNGPSSTVVAGDPAALEAWMGACEERGWRVRRIAVDYASHTAHVDDIAEELTGILAAVAPVASRVPFYSTVDAAPIDTTALDAAYWTRNLRSTVRFEETVEALIDDGFCSFVESSAHAVLAVGLTETIDAVGAEAVVVGSLRRNEGGAARFLTSAAEAFVHGVPVDWARLFPENVAQVELPTYPFQRRRYWLAPDSGAGDVSAAGLVAAEHPLLGAAVAMASADEVLFTGRLSLRTHPWLADHRVGDTVLLPGTAFVELAVRAGDEVGCGRVEEITLQTPLILPAQGSALLQMSVGAADDEGRRAVTVHSRPGDATGDEPWLPHATGVLAPDEPDAEPFDATAWPPQGAEAMDLDGLYDGLLDQGYGYGPVFRGLRAAWRSGDTVFAEVALPEGTDAGGFALHPALLDAALHGWLAAGRAERAEGTAASATRLPFAWGGVSLHAIGAAALRVRLSPLGDDEIAVEAADASGAPVASVRSLTMRAIAAESLRPSAAGADALFALDWVPVATEAAPDTAAWAVIGDAEGLLDGVAGGERFADVAALRGELDGGAAAPDVAVHVLAADEGDDMVGAVHRGVAHALAEVRAWLADERLADARLVVVARGAGSGASLTAAAAWGLLRSAQSEQPDRLVLVDLDPADEGEADGAALAALPAAAALGLAGHEPQLRLSGGRVLAPRLARPGVSGALVPPVGAPWCLDTVRAGTFENLALLPRPEAAAPLDEGQVRVAVRAAGLNFRDVLIGLGMAPGQTGMGGEIAGVVAEVGPGVGRFAPGDPVLGVVDAGFGLGPLAITDERRLARLPDGWSFASGAATPSAFLTAFFGLVELGGLRAGERVLVHAAAGGVGMAAVRLARQLGAEVFGTASEGKWDALRELGLDDDHIASSRTLDFEEKFRRVTGGAGMDVVLDSLAGEFVDASLRLLPRGGRFLEMGKTDIRDAERVAHDHPGVAYQAYDLKSAGPERVERMLAVVMGLFHEGVIEPLPTTEWDVRRAPEAFRFMSQARHTGKIVLRMPPTLDPDGTVLLTGGTGTLGAHVARHLVTRHGVRHLLLASRRGPAAPGAAALIDELTELGARVAVAACDTGDREAVATLLGGIDEAHPLTAVVHAAGLLDDAVIGTMTDEQLSRVLRSKVDAAWHLHELTRGHDLAAFVLFSSAAGVIGGPGQGNYAAANAFLDALAARRRAEGLPAQSLAWGLWAEGSGMTGHLDEADLARMARGGVLPVASEQGLALFDAATALDEPVVLPVRLDLAALRALAAQGGPPPVFRGLVRGAPGARRSAATGTGAGESSLVRRLLGLPEADRERALVDLVRTHASAVLGHGAGEAVDVNRGFKDLGFDSLTAVELRNRLHAATGLRLRATLVFDHPTPAALARHLRDELLGAEGPEGAENAEDTQGTPAAGGDEPIAIVAMACRLPGDVRTPEDLWRLVAEGGDAITGLPANRGWDLEALYDPDPTRPGTSYVTEGGFVHDADAFDAEFFGISPREALAMDPQQRLLLETSWELFERAGIATEALRGSRTGVFAGLIAQGYAPPAHLIPEELEGYLGTGNTTSVGSGRVAYTFGLEGPAVTVDTACSSSLVALHLAVRALRNGECAMAVAGGATVVAEPSWLIDFSRQRGLAVDGRSKAFAASADGLGPAEGVGLVLVERLSDAERLGHPVLAVIRGSAINQDGASNGLTAPSGPSQERVIRQALADARLRVDDVDAVEAHGTGTALGDPIEAQALQAVYGTDRDAERPLWLGSLKSNIGHTQAAAGIAGVLKMVMALRHGVLPRTLHVDEPSPHVDWSAGAVELLTEAREWPETGRPRRAGVSSFGISGTNAHLILEQAPEPEPVAVGETEVIGGVVPWVVSARGEAALAEQVARLGELGSSSVEVGWSLLSGRSLLDDRAVVLDGSGEPIIGRAGAETGAVFVFPGQGAQWSGMALELADAFPVFRAALEECAAALAEFVEWDFWAELNGDLARVDVVQPLSWAVMVSLARLWEWLGVRPSAVVGHSQGEVAAAVVAGGLSLDDGARVVALRSALIGQRLAGRGGMVSVAVGAGEAEESLSPFGGLSVAAVNGPSSTVVAGDPEALDAWMGACEERGWRVRRIAVDYASHTAHVDDIAEELTERLAAVAPVASRVPFYSTVDAAPIDTTALDAAYWTRNLRSTVRFEETVEALLRDGHGCFVESSAHPVLAVGLTETVDAAAAEAVVVGSLRRNEGGAARFLTSAAEAFVRGVPVDWARLFPENVGRVELPTYPFQRRRYWLEVAADADRDELPGDEVERRFWDAVEREDLQSLATTLEFDDDRLRDVLPALSSWRRRRRERSTLDSWRYRVTWRPRVGGAPAALTGTWLLIAPAAPAAAPWAEAVERALLAAGCRVLARPVDTGGADRASFTALVDEATVEAGAPLAGVLSLLALDDDPVTGHPAVTRGHAASLALIQALIDTPDTGPLWCATRRAVSTGEREPALSADQATLWGLGRVVALEQPGLWGGLVDLPEEPDERALARLAGVVAGADGEDQVALRASGALVRRIVRAPLGDARPVRSWTPDGTTLITGGTGGLGAQVARWAARNGAEHLLLLSRRGPEAPGAAELADELRESGAEVTLVPCDVADRDALAAVIADIPADRPLRTVVHTAATLDDGIVDSLTVERLDRVLRVKAQGAVHLHELTRESELSAFVLFSSFSAVFGVPGLGNYAPGNAFLEALAEQRRAEGLPATAVSWGIWAGAGMAEGSVGERARRHGVHPMDPETATVALGQALDHDDTTIGLMEVGWERFSVIFTSERPSRLMDEVPEARRALAAAEAAPEAGAGEDATGLAARLRDLSDAERERRLTELVASNAAGVLGLAAAPDPTRPFRAIGFDSLTAVELRNRLNSLTGLRLPATLVFDHPTPATLARHLRDELLGAAEADDTPARPVPGAADDDPVVIVGMACRYPGGVRSPEDLWRLADEGGDVISPLPTNRGWRVSDLYDPDPDAAGRTYVEKGGFLHDADEFDPAFFGISPREALAMDPQQRLLLETSWEAIERAGIDPASLKGTPVGVFTGMTHHDYGHGASHDAHGIEGYQATGTIAAVASGRIAYTLGLEGPAVTIDTACSSSLVALHLAAQALRNGECSLALAGGVTVMPSPSALVVFSRQRALARDGRCKAFAASADGFAVGEGAGMLLVERLSDARRLGHRVLAVVKGSAVNQDGASNGLTAPNGPSQQRVIGRALANAGVTPHDIDAVEAHGTGTALGDPIEAQALLATYGRNRDVERPLWLGSIKSNIGHTQAAAGAAGLIKMVMAMRHGVLPRTLHVDEPSPHVDWSSGGVELLTEPRAWPETGRARRAAVSAFGISGTNAHVILEQPEPAQELAEASAGAPGGITGGVVPWVVSGHGGDALRDQAARLRAALDAAPHPDNDADPLAVGASLLSARSLLGHRAVVLGTGRASLLDGLDTVASGASAPAVVVGQVAETASRTAFVFPGQGAQWAGMALELADAFPAFRAAMDACAEALRPFVAWDLWEELATPTERLDVIQPLCWAVMVSLARLWEWLGVAPDAVVGHSQGEIAAAVIAGGLSLDDGALVVARRSALLARRLAGRGGMASAAVPADQVAASLAAWEGRLSVAVINGPAATVVSGDPDALEAWMAAADERGWRVRRVAVDCASHSAQVDDIADELAEILAPVAPRSSRVPFYSTVDAAPMDTAGLDAAYWVRNMRETVRFRDTVDVLIAEGHGRFIEASAHPVLSPGLAETVEAAGGEAVVVGSLRRDEGGAPRFLTSVAEAFVGGVPVDWARLFPERTPRVDLPTSAFQRQRYWLEAAEGAPSGADGASDVDARFWAAVEEENAEVLAEALEFDGEGLSAVLPALSSWRRRQRERASLDAWAYRTAWHPVAGTAPALDGVWLLAVPARRADHPWAEGAERALRDHGADVVRLAVDPAADRATLATLLGGTLTDTPLVSGVLSLLALDDAPVPAAPAQSAGTLGNLALLQAMGDIALLAPLWCATSGAVATGPGDRLDSPAQAMTWGLGRAAASEHPRRWGGLVDLPASPDEPGAAPGLAAALTGAGPAGEEDQVAVRPGAGLLAARLERATRPGGPLPAEWRPSRGTVLITGGTGALGGHIAHWLARAGAEHLLLVGRRGPEAPGAAELAAELEALGTRVTVARCDVADRAALAELLDAIPAELPLTAVFHTAAVLDDTLLDALTPESMNTVAAAKALAAHHLHELTAGAELTAFVLFSSFAGTVPNVGQGNYAAANAYLDALALHRRAAGLPALSVPWGHWGGAGAVAGEVGERLSSDGVPPMEPALAVAGLARALADGERLLAIVDIDWSRVAPLSVGARPHPLITGVPEALQALDAARAREADDARAGTDLAKRLADLSDAERDRELIALVRSLAATSLGHADVDAVPGGRSFKDLGFDSIAAVDLRNRLGAVTGTRLSASVVFDHPNATALARHLKTQLVGEDEAPALPALGELERLEAALAGISPHETETRRRIGARLQVLMTKWHDAERTAPARAASGDELDTASDDELFDLLDDELEAP